MPKTQVTAVCGGLLSGLFAGFFGVGGAVRGAFLTAFNLRKEVYVFTSGLIALFIDATRVSRYVWGGTRLEESLLYALAACIPFSFFGAYAAKKSLDRLPQRFFIAKKSIVGSIPDIVFCAIDTGSLTIPALWGGILFGVVEAIAGGVIGDALTNVVAGFFEGGALLNGFEKGKL